MSSDACVICDHTIDKNDMHWLCTRGFESGVDKNGEVVYEEDGDEPVYICDECMSAFLLRSVVK